MFPLMNYKTPGHQTTSSASTGTTHQVPSKDRLMCSFSPAHRDALMTSNVPTTPYQHHLFNTLLGPNRSLIVSPPVQASLEKPWKVYTQTILDSGGIADDFYVNPLDWRYGHLLYGCSHQVAICTLSNSPRNSMKITSIVENNPEDIKWVHSVEWNREQPHAAVGYDYSVSAFSLIQIWDCTTKKHVSEIQMPRKFYSLTWKDENQITISSGNSICHCDTRMKEIAWSTQHLAISRSVRWNDNNYLAIGSDKGEVKVSDARQIRHSFFGYFHNTSVVKALQWHPTNPSILATGGGVSDRCLTIVNVDQQKLRVTKNLGNQICDLKWFDDSHIVLGLGLPNTNTIRVESWNGKEGLQTVLCQNQKKNQRVLSVTTTPEKTSFATLSQDYIMIHRLKEFKPHYQVAIR